jgi:hypothetical protein
MTESWPDMSTELTRKAMECALKHVDHAENGGSLGGLALVLDVLTDITQGLIENDQWQILYDLRQNTIKEIRLMVAKKKAAKP